MQLGLHTKHRKKIVGRRHLPLREGDSLVLPQRKQPCPRGHKGGEGTGRRPF